MCCENISFSESLLERSKKTMVQAGKWNQCRYHKYHMRQLSETIYLVLQHFLYHQKYISFIFSFLSLSPFFDDFLVVRAWRKSWSRSKSPGPRCRYGNNCEYLQMVFNTRFQSFHLFQFKTNFMWNMLQWCFTNESLNDDDIPILWKVEWV